MYRKGRAWLELSRLNLVNNVEVFRRLLPEGCRIMAAVKANAYGHGAVETARILQECGIEDFCVAAAAEGIELRRHGIGGQILILGYTHPQQLEEAVRYDLTQTVVDAAYGEELRRFGKRIKVHVCIDTGMHRLGERFERVEDICAIWRIPNLVITGVYSHLCAADSLGREECEYTLRQAENFLRVVGMLKERGIGNFSTHLLSSYGVLNYPALCGKPGSAPAYMSKSAYLNGERRGINSSQCAPALRLPAPCCDYARIGIALYGTLSSLTDETLRQPDLRPVLTLKTRVECVRTLKKGEGAGYGLTFAAVSPMKIAALSIGYADGIPREMSGRGYVLIRGKKAPVVGRICMDQMLVDVTDIEEAVPGEEAVVIGRSGSGEISAPLFASWSDTISNEILSRLGGRLERVVC